MSWKAEIKTAGDRDWVGNGLRFATDEEARLYAASLACRWTAVREWRVVECKGERWPDEMPMSTSQTREAGDVA